MYGSHHPPCLADVILSQALWYPFYPSPYEAYYIEVHTQRSVWMTGGHQTVYHVCEHGETAGKVFGSCCGQAWEVDRVLPGDAVWEVHACACCGSCSDQHL